MSSLKLIGDVSPQHTATIPSSPLPAKKVMHQNKHEHLDKTLNIYHKVLVSQQAQFFQVHLMHSYILI